ncbi:NAD(+) diphosphatase [Qingshengfaniella alkalisoli]|uniref:NAD(+) diphosphatase n=1 Tax=Qingshengfaniella alkalisoli TaxID=2599296 RepID=A0A5B8I5M5_9RHOB|nr:NAD(+) diphosphatase [Qingshengfaniella alkalisoli]QDY68625.1 NAD(+) diphosphatase [Qingshengfaniella alkalisoli]
MDKVTFARAGFDCAAHLRAKPPVLADLWHAADAKVLPLSGGLLPCDDTAGLRWSPSTDHVDRFDAALFLGISDAGPRFALEVDDPACAADLRDVMARLSPSDASLAATARSLFEWHRRHGFCANCGVRSDIANGGWTRICPTCGAEHYPRTDPVVIMLVTHGNSVLVGRSPGWPDGMYSLLAGFVEPGETVEDAVRREVFEESGVRVGPVKYLVSQPWPFPSSLMLGCAAVAESTGITLDPVELEDACWITREDMMSIVHGGHATMRLGRKGAVARYIVEKWLADELEGIPT